LTTLRGIFWTDRVEENTVTRIWPIEVQDCKRKEKIQNVGENTYYRLSGCTRRRLVHTDRMTIGVNNTVISE
jgi:hypothetical protein